MLSRSLLRCASSMKARFQELLPASREKLTKLRLEHGDKSLGDVTVDQTLGGMRAVRGLLTDTSKLDGQFGIRFRGLSLPECQKKLPRKNVEPLPEGMLYLLLTGEVPTNQQAEEVRQDLAARAALPPTVEQMMFSLPKTMHPMTQLSMGVLALQPHSEFLRQYEEGGLAKGDYWKPTYEDALNLVAKIPRLAAIIYRHTYKDGKIAPLDPSLDLSQNFSRMLGFESEQFSELMRLYLTIHTDHEGGNVSAHATHLVGSALADAYLSYSAGLNGLAGPLHGLANQECLKFLMDLQKTVGDNPDESAIEIYVKNLLKTNVVPGYGHAVLRVTDPRFDCQKDFAERVMPDDPLCRLVRLCYKVVPKILQATGKVKNPWPNVDAHSGALLYHFGMKEFDYYTVMFGVSRAIGCMASLVWSRGLVLPIERPSSVTMEWLEDFVAKKA